jgi:O-antigen ligase
MELGLGLSTLLVVPLYIAGILAIVLTLFYRIEIGIFFLIPFLPNQNILNHLNELPLGKDINDFLIMAMLFRWVVDKGKTNEKLFVKTPLNLPIFLFLIWTFIEIWWGAKFFGDPLQFSLENPRVIYWKNLIRLPLLYLIVVNNIKNPDHKKLIIFLMIVAILILDRNFYNIARWRDFSHYSDEQKVGGMAQNLGSNELAVFLAMYAVVLVSLFMHARNVWLKIFLAGPILASYSCILFLFSRSGYLAAFVGIVIVGLLKDKKILLVLVVLIFAWQTILPNAVIERIDMTQNEEDYDVSTQQRFGMWELGKDIVLSSPIFGAGIDAARYINITVEGFDSRLWHSFHNAYIQQAVETGLVGLAIYLWIYLSMIFTGWRLYKTSDEWFKKALGLGLLSCVITCLAGNLAGGYWNFIGVVGYMYVLAGLVTQDLITIDRHGDSSLSYVANSDKLNVKKLLPKTKFQSSM